MRSLRWLLYLVLSSLFTLIAAPAFADGIGGGAYLIYLIFFCAIVVAVLVGIGLVAWLVWYLIRRWRR